VIFIRGSPDRSALLLFTIGVEFSIDTIKKVGKIVILGSIFQAVLCIVLGVLVLPLLGYSEYEAFFIAVLTSTSSTVFVVKMLEAKEQLNTRAGNIMMGWLIMQDLLIVVWFLLFQTFAPNSETSGDILLPMIKGLSVIAITFLLGRYLLPAIMRQIARTRSEELLVVSVVGVIALFAVIANAFGISYTLGAFLAGLALSESFLNHEIFTEIKPIRNLLTMIFFVSIGAMINISSLADQILPLLVILLLIIGFKILVIVLINIWFKVHIKTALKVGLGISQIGEFAFLGAQLALTSGWIDTALYTLLISVTIISMSITPLLYSMPKRSMS
jgi:CPA2 family monovalent cation:H+ antiporter-2